MATHSDWLALVELSGLVISEPVLEERFPGGPSGVPRGLQGWFRSKSEHFNAALESGNEAGIRQWIDFMLETLTGMPADHWAKASKVPDSCRLYLEDYQQELKADRVLLRDETPRLLAMIVPAAQYLDRQDKQAGRWKATPSAKLEHLLNKTGCPLGLVTNGRVFRLMYVPENGSTGTITWTTPGLVQEKSTLDAFVTLLGRDCLIPDDKDVLSLRDMCRLSRDRQVEVADQLGIQVREGLAQLILAWDEADRATNGDLLSNRTDEKIYEMGLVVMMRLVFLLYAEERSLLPHGDVLYDQGYGLTWLWHYLQTQKHEQPAAMDLTFDAWDRILSTGRLIYGGCVHPDLSLRAYQGHLFDPQRYPELEDLRMQVSNRTVYEVLYRLLFARQRRGGEPQRVGYWALDIEQIGYVYEGLLDHRCGRAGDVPVIHLKGGGEDAIPVTELEQRTQEKRIEYIANMTGRKSETIESALADPSAEDLELLSSYPPETAERIRPFAGVVQCQKVVPPGWRYLTVGTSRRETGTQYTPQMLTEPIVARTLEPLVYQCEEGKPGKYVLSEHGERILKAPREILSLKVCDPAMGSGAFLVQVVRYLGNSMVESWKKVASQKPEGAALTIPYAEKALDPEGQDVLHLDDDEWLTAMARRLVVERCVYGVDINPLAVEMGKLSLWIITLSKDKPFTFVDHALKCGDSLLGCDLEQLRTCSLDRKGSGLPIVDSFLESSFTKALEARRELVKLSGTESNESKAALHRNADEAMQRARLVGNALVAAWLTAGSAKERESLAQDWRTQLSAAKANKDWEKLTQNAEAGLAHKRPFHWPLEFPEVFLDSGGFDAFVGNPPFMGGKKISLSHGTSYREWLVEILGKGKRGNADLVAYFYLRSFSLLRSYGVFGLLATNTIAQGDTREVGLEQILVKGGHIFHAITSMPWPGVASLEVSVVHLHRGDWHGTKSLDNRPIQQISALLDEGASLGNPHRLASNQNLSFQGSILLGLGFTMSPEKAQEWIAKDLRNAVVLQPYLNGKDLNSHPEQRPPRWVINFREWPLEQAEQWPELLAIVREQVKYERENKSAAVAAAPWWQYWRYRSKLYRTIEPLERVLAVARISRTLAFVFLPKGWVYNEKIVLFPTDRASDFAVLQSALHGYWAWHYSSTLKTDLNYSPSDCFDTFPFPQKSTALDDVGERYHEHRRQVMLDKQLGLTKTYDQFHNPDCKNDDIQQLRRLHVELDNAVRDAYGWSDLELGHGWVKTVSTEEKKNAKTGKVDIIEKVDWRYTISEQARKEVLRRLLALNHQRHAEEGAQKQPEKKKGRNQKKANNSKQPAETSPQAQEIEEPPKNVTLSMFDDKS